MYIILDSKDSKLKIDLHLLKLCRTAMSDRLVMLDSEAV